MAYAPRFTRNNRGTFVYQINEVVTKQTPILIKMFSSAATWENGLFDCCNQFPEVCSTDEFVRIARSVGRAGELKGQHEMVTVSNRLQVVYFIYHIFLVGQYQVQRRWLIISTESGEFSNMAKQMLIFEKRMKLTF